MLAIWTGLSRDLDSDGEAAIRATSPFWKDHDQGSATSLVAAFDPALNGKPETSSLSHNTDGIVGRSERYTAP
jgi:hypothetical protein